MGDAVPHAPCQRDTIPLESHFSTNDSMVRAEIRFSALFMCEHAKRKESVAQALSKACRFLGQRPKSRSAERETPPPSQRSGGGLGEPYQGVPPRVSKGAVPLWSASADAETLFSSSESRKQRNSSISYPQNQMDAGDHRSPLHTNPHIQSKNRRVEIMIT